MSSSPAHSLSNFQPSGVAVYAINSEGHVGEPEQHPSLDAALQQLEKRSGNYFIKALSVTAEQARAIAQCAATAQQELSIGVIPTDRSPHSFVTPGAPLSRQVVFDAIRGSYTAAKVTALHTPANGVLGDAALQQPADVAYFIAHSNGMHADGVVGVLCQHGLRKPETESIMSCFSGDACAFPGRAVPPQLIGARHIVALTCWGMRLDNLYERRLSVGAAILELPELRSYVTTVRAVNVHYTELGLFYFLVNSGLSFGEITNRVNRARLREGLDVEYVCFGNPASVLPKTIREGKATCGDGNIIRLRFEAGDGPQDFVFTLPFTDGGRRPGQIVKFEGRCVPASAVLDDNQLYASIAEPLDEPRDIVLRIGRLEDLRDHARLPKDLLRDLATTRAFFPFAPGISPRSRRVIRKATDDMTTYLVAWPYLSCEPGECLTEQEIAFCDLELKLRLKNYSDALLAGYRDLVRKGGPGGAVASGAVWARVARLSHRGLGRCPYCGSAVVDSTYTSIADDVSRIIAYCDRCGLIRDCPPGFCGDLGSPTSVSLGSSFTLQILMKNPYSSPLEVFGTAFVQALRVADSSESTPVRQVLPPGKAEVLRFEINPSVRHPGVYVLSACVIIGTRFNLLRNHICMVP